MPHRVAVLASCLALLAAPALADGIDLKPGQWERDTTVTTIITVEGETTTLPVESSVAGECLVGDDARIDPADLAQAGCSFTELAGDATTLSFAMACDQESLQLDGTMKMTSNADGSKLDGAITMSGTHPNGVSMTSNVIIRSRWTGDC